MSVSIKLFIVAVATLMLGGCFGKCEPTLWDYAMGTEEWPEEYERKCKEEEGLIAPREDAPVELLVLRCDSNAASLSESIMTASELGVDVVYSSCTDLIEPLEVSFVPENIAPPCDDGYYYGADLIEIHAQSQYDLLMSNYSSVPYDFILKSCDETL